MRHATLNAGFGLGALLAAVLLAGGAPSRLALLYVLDALSFLALIPILLAVPALGRPARVDDAGAVPSGYREILRDRLFRRLWGLMALLVTVGYAQYHAAFPVYATTAGGVSASGLSAAFAANTFTVVGAQLLMLRLLAGRRRTRGVALVGALFAGAWAITLLAGQLAGGGATVLFALAMVVLGLGETALAPIMPALVNDLAPERLRGRYNGAFALAWTSVRVRALSDLAGLHRVLGHYGEAQATFRRALAVAERCCRADALETAAVLNGLAVTLKCTGGFAEAERLYRRALAITAREFGDQHPDVATLYHNLGGLAHARGDYAAAEPPARRSVAIRARARGDDHPELAADRAALAAVLDALGQHDEAEALLRAALHAFEATFGDEHYEVASCLNNLAAICYRRGGLDQAEALYRRALATKEALLGPEHPELATLLNNLAVLATARTDNAEAARLYRRAIALLEPAVTPDHPTLVTCRHALGALADSRHDAGCYSAASAVSTLGSIACPR